MVFDIKAKILLTTLGENDTDKIYEGKYHEK